MSLDRRSFLKSAAGAGALSLLPELPASAEQSRFTTEQLEQAAAKRVLNVKSIKTPVIIRSIELLRSGREYLVHSR